MSDEELELRPVMVNGETVYVNRFGDLWRWKQHRQWSTPKFMKIDVKLRNGYKNSEINKKQVGHHRIIALAFLGLDMSDLKIEVDHRNNIRHDNRLENLRLVTPQQNSFNRTKVKGYNFDKKNNKWKAYIYINSISIHLGMFTTEEDAHRAYLDAKAIHHKIP